MLGTGDAAKTCGESGELRIRTAQGGRRRTSRRASRRTGQRAVRLRAGGSRAALVALAALLVGLPAVSQADFVASPDSTVALGPADLVTPDEAALDTAPAPPALVDLGPLPDPADVIAIGTTPDAVGAIMALETATALTGGVVALPGDVVAWNGFSHSVLFDARAEGVPDGVRVDAASLGEPGLLLSLDTDAVLGGVKVADEDLVYSAGGGSYLLALDGSAAGIDSALDIDAAHDLGGGDYLVSFDSTGVVGGIVFADEDVLRLEGGVWSLAVDGSAVDADWETADLDALTVPVPEPAAALGLAAGLGLLAGLARRRRRPARTSAPRAPAPAGAPLLALAVALAVPLAAALPAAAADGVRELNQTCAVNTGCGPTDAAGFPITLASGADASYRLTSDLVVPDEDFDAIRVSPLAGPVTIDLAGFEITSATCPHGNCVPVSGLGVGVRAEAPESQRGLEVRDGTIAGMGSDAVQLGPEARLIGLRTRSNGGDGIDTREAAQVLGCSAVANGGGGFSVGEGSVVLDSVARENQAFGLVQQKNSWARGNVLAATTGGSDLLLAGGRDRGPNRCADGSCRSGHRRRYYLTTTQVSAPSAPGACANGYHFASLLELQTPGVLEYDATLGEVLPDSGSSHTLFLGWVRSGENASTSRNCSDWTDAGVVQTGTALSHDGSNPEVDGFGNLIEFGCVGPARTWCIQD